MAFTEESAPPPLKLREAEARRKLEQHRYSRSVELSHGSLYIVVGLVASPIITCRCPSVPVTVVRIGKMLMCMRQRLVSVPVSMQGVCR